VLQIEEMTQREPGAAGLREGEVLDDRYRVERIIGSGGMGVVVAAHHVNLDQRVAIKLLRSEAAWNADATSRFAREAKAAVKIKSEHVAQVLDVGTLRDGTPFIVMEYLEGIDLAAWLKKHGPLPVEQAVEFILQACVAIADAHALGIVHRDLKPANLFCVRRSDGRSIIKVLDFGISKMPGTGESGAVTRTSAMLGSPLYMSPEQMRSSRDVDARADVWSMGVILFELLAGRPAFPGEKLTEVVLKVTGEPPPSLRRLRPEVPGGLEAIVVKCLEKDRARRFQDVAALAQALRAFAPPRAHASIDRVTDILASARVGGVSALASTADPDSHGPPLVDTSSGLGHTTDAGRRRVRPIVAGVAVLLSVAAALALALLPRVRALSAVPDAPAGSPAPPAETPVLSAAEALAPPLSLAPSVAPASPPPSLPAAPVGSSLPRARPHPAPQKSPAPAHSAPREEHDVF
jgi:serine/threonine protein kinase